MGPSKDDDRTATTKQRPPRKSHDDKKNQKEPHKNEGRRRDGAKVVMSVEAFAHRKGGAAKSIEGFRKRKEAKRLETSKELRSYQRLMKSQGYEPGTGASRRRHEKEGGENDADDDDDDDDDDDAEEVVARPSQRSDDSRGRKESGRGGRDNGVRTSTNERSAASKGDQDEFFQPADDDEDRVRPGHGDDAAAARKHGVPRDAASNKKERLPHKASKHFPHKSSLQRVADRRLEQIQQEQERRQQQEKERAQKLRERRQRTKMLGERTKKGQPIMKNIVHDILRKLELDKEQQQEQQQQPAKR